MEFGRLESEGFEQVDFTLPPDHIQTANVLATSKNKGPAKFYVGCAKWGRKDWVGKIYPLKTKEADFLEHYARHFNSIELNATFYKIPTKTQTATWRKKVGPDFLFCPKFSQSITHIRRLKNTAEVLQRFIDGISGFENNLGPVLLMPHPQMGPKTLEAMQLFMEELPNEFEVFVELRHADWFKDTDAYNAICKTMETRKAGSVITDASGRRDCVHMRLTTPEAFVRFVGNGLHPTDYTRVDEWVQRIKQWNEKGLKKVFFFMHQHEEIYSPQLAAYVIRELNKHCGTNIAEPQFEEAAPA